MNNKGYIIVCEHGILTCSNGSNYIIYYFQDINLILGLISKVNKDLIFKSIEIFKDDHERLFCDKELTIPLIINKSVRFNGNYIGDWSLKID